MEIRTNKNSYLGNKDAIDINDTMDMIVCALILEGWNVDTIYHGLMNKAESMTNEFNLNNDDEK